MTTGKRMTQEEKQWKGRDAARTLMEAERIKSDPVLSKLAAIEAQNMIKEHQKTMEAMGKVASIVKKPAKKSTKKTTTPRGGKRK